MPPAATEVEQSSVLSKLVLPEAGNIAEGAMATTTGKDTAWIGRDTTTVSRKEFDRILRELTTGARETETPGAYRGLWYLRFDNTVIGVRISEFYGCTIDIIDSGGSLLLRTGARIHCLD